MTDRASLGWRGNAAITLGLPVLRLLASTWRYSIHNREALQELRNGRRPFVFSLWHGHLLPLLWLHRAEGVRVLISEHRDGEIIARIALGLGYGTIRGSTRKGGERALLALVRALEEGREVAITPDGPRGPAHAFQPGAVVAAARARAPILPIAAHTNRAWRLGSWDRFLVPKPFARVSVAYGAPVMIEAARARDAAQQTPLMQSAMRAAVERAADG